MRLIPKTGLATAMLAAALLLPVAAFAATGDSTAADGSRQQKVEQRIADMHATLHITQAQEAQWDAFAQVMLDNAQAMDGLLTRGAGDLATQTAPQILQNYAVITQQHAQNVQKLSAAFNALYTDLTPEQKKAADEMFRSTAVDRQQKAGG